MKAMINIKGTLKIERKRKFTAQFCPYQSNGIFLFCGDTCPLFIELQGSIKSVQLFCSPIPLMHQIMIDEREEK